MKCLANWRKDLCVVEEEEGGRAWMFCSRGGFLLTVKF